MAQPYIGEIRMFAGTYAPSGWAYCNGQQLPISENEALYQLIGTTYGGDGESTFNLPNLQSRVPIHKGNGPDGNPYPLAQMAGTETVTLTVQQIPSHNHVLIATDAAGTLTPGNATLAKAASSQQGVKVYNNAPAAFVQLRPETVGASGGSQPHENCQPFLCVNFIISLFGIFPTQT
jgi:microcystin-dependent protein